MPSKVRIRSKSVHITFLLISLIYIYTYIIQYKITKIPYFLLIFGCMAILSTINDKNNFRISFQKYVPKEILLWMIFAGYVTIIGVVLAPKLSEHISMTITVFEYLVLCMCLCVSCQLDDNYQKYLNVLIIVAVVAVIYYAIDPIELSSGRYLAFSEDSNATSYTQILIYGVWAMIYKFSQKKMSFVVLAAGIVSCAYFIILSGSRKSLISLVILVIYWIVFVLGADRKERGKAIFIILVIAVVSYIAYTQFYVDSYLQVRMESMESTLEDSERAEMYAVGFKYFLQSPILGRGFWAFASMYGNYSHSTIVEVFVSGGVFGAIMYFGSYFVSWQRLTALKKRATLKSMRSEVIEIKMLIGLLLVLSFNTTCVIHIYKLDSLVVFGLLLGGTQRLARIIKDKNYAEQIELIAEK